MPLMPKNGRIDSDLDVARRVLRLEAGGLEALADALDARFSAAVDMLAAADGRIIVSGMGKSGQIGRKIASTLASVGRPALFVHPAEASHGDLGMIAPGDAVLALSNSGETEELTDLINHAKRFAIPLIAITGAADSTLAQAADLVLVLPGEAEACPFGLAPTTSTTMALALGDALAVALIERMGFSETDFHALHPGGKLGRKLLRVADLMHGHDELPVTGPQTTMADALIVMTQKRFGCVGVVDHAGRLIGIVTDGDLRRHMSDGLLQAKTADIMTASPRTIRPQALASEALGIMNGNRITSLFVIENDRPIGILHIHDCLRAGVA